MYVPREGPAEADVGDAMRTKLQLGQDQALACRREEWGRAVALLAAVLGVGTCLAYLAFEAAERQANWPLDG